VRANTQTQAPPAPCEHPARVLAHDARRESRPRTARTRALADHAAPLTHARTIATTGPDTMYLTRSA
jgi:hypothetical protein